MKALTEADTVKTSPNRSLGKQIQNKIKDYPIGTKFGEFTIK